MSYGVFADIGTIHVNDAQLFDGRAITAGSDGVPVSGEVVSEVFVPKLHHFGLTFEVISSVAGALKIEEFTGDGVNPHLGYPTADFVQFEANVAIAASTPKKQDYDSTFRPLRAKFTPTAPPGAPYTLKILVKSKGA